MRNNAVEYLEQRIFRVIDRKHIIYLYYVTRRIKNVFRDAYIINNNIDKMDNYVRAHSNDHGRPYTFLVELDKTELEKKDRYTEFKHVREIIEYEYPAGNFSGGNRGVERKRRQSAYWPKHKQIANALVSCKYRNRQEHRVEWAKMERQIFQGRAPSYKIENDRGDARKGQYAEDYHLRFKSSSLEYKIQTDDNARA